MKLLLSSYSLEPFPLEEIFLLGRELNADGLELVLTGQVFRLGINRISQLAGKYNLPIINLHQPAWGIFFTPRWGVLKLVDVARSLGVENVVVHLATVRRSARSRFFDWVRHFEKSSGVNVAFENSSLRFLEQFPRYAADPARLEQFVASRKVNIALDVPKLFLNGGDPYQFFQRCQNSIKTVHVSGFDNEAWHLGLDGRNFDWFGFVSFLKKHHFQGAVNLEVFPVHQWLRFGRPGPEQLLKAKEIIKESFEVLQRA